MIDTLVLIVGKITYYVEEFLGLPLPPPPGTVVCNPKIDRTWR